MDSSFDMFNHSSYFPIYPYPLSVSTEISSLNSLSFRSNNNITTNDYSSYYPDNISNIYTNSPINHSNTIDVDQSPEQFNNCSSLLLSRSDHCLVCNDRASGIHFGVSTCEACKAFFRRTSLSSYTIPHPCSPIRCEINSKNRNNCPSCRFDKCKRLGMDRDNVIYGKPSKQQMNLSYEKNLNFIKQLTNISNELIKIFYNIHSIYQISNNIDNKQQIDYFGQIAYQFFYQQTFNINSSDIIHKIFLLLFNSYKNNFLFDYILIENINLQAILCLWLFIYYYQTYLLKENICKNKLTILIKLLDLELMKMNDHNKQKNFRINFINTFTKFTDLILQEIQLEN